MKSIRYIVLLFVFVGMVACAAIPADKSLVYKTQESKERVFKASTIALKGLGWTIGQVDKDLGIVKFSVQNGLVFTHGSIHVTNGHYVIKASSRESAVGTPIPTVRDERVAELNKRIEEQLK